MNHNTEHNLNKEEDSNELTSSLMKVVGVFNYRGLLVEKTKEDYEIDKIVTNFKYFLK
jgi:hypothetical protein